MHFFVRRIGVLPGYALIDQKGRDDIKPKFSRDVEANVSTIGALVCCPEGDYLLKPLIRERLLGSDPDGAVAAFRNELHKLKLAVLIRLGFNDVLPRDAVGIPKCIVESIVIAA